ncbi:Synembryn-like protein C3E7.04c [Tolypocladium ophioglossoides CBS 100239]|uniref:Synembryn-like protein C3E7.04c n=1 Tax=Tolypocladium ophioglossoides (strain CBS 100239) TaxID=1163406 RepID=A0A0L0NBM8_TOLOC|nr:Synembryn-like protein C3E7.04c [Tolypocladium ophioglossoides CBS 100239]
MTTSAVGTASGPAKLKAVADLVDKLTEDLDKITLLPKARNEALEQLKVHGRDPKDADPIFTKEGISMLLRHAFYSPSTETARAALRVLANAMLLKPETRQMFVDEGFATRACSELKMESWDNEFLVSRILFLSTYDTDVDLLNLIEKHRLADHIVENLHRHAKVMSSKAKTKAEPMEEMALGETLKLMFNVTHYCNQRVSSFTPAVPHVVALLWKHDIPSSKPLDPPFGPLVNALLNLDMMADKSQSALYPKSEPNKVSLRLVELLGKSMKAYNDSELETVVTPLVSLVGRLYESAPQAVQQNLRDSLLPTAEDRQGVLGRGETLSASLLKNSTNPLAPALREAISQLLFDLSGKDASKFVENVGYGFASGFLFQNNVPIPASASEAFSTGDATGAQRPVNPITGQFLDKETLTGGPEMSQEEKEREAERLFVLFERLKANGLIDVQNPVERAVQEGRFRELDDEEVEELD